MKEFLKIAEELFSIGITHKGKKREFYFRSAISRAYYGALWYIRDLYGLKGTDLHSMVRAVLAEKDIILKIKLDTLGKIRNIADYQKNPKIVFDISTTRKYIYLAKEIISKVRV